MYCVDQDGEVKSAISGSVVQEMPSQEDESVADEGETGEDAADEFGFGGGRGGGGNWFEVRGGGGLLPPHHTPLPLFFVCVFTFSEICLFFSNLALFFEILLSFLFHFLIFF